MRPARFAQLPRWLRDFAPLILCMGLIFWLSSRSILVTIDDPANEKLFFKSSHVIAYAALAWLWWRTLSARRLINWPILAMTLTFTILYGISDEIHQLFVPGRHGRVADVLFDASGALLMVLLLRRITWLRSFPENLPFFWIKSEGKSAQVVSSQEL